MARPARVEVGDVVLGGKYRVERLLGEGGMGVVVLARHVELGQAVAIKVLRDDSEEDVVRRFMREARSAVRLTSDHVVRVHDVGRLENGAPYMLMEYLEGEDLGAVVSRGALELGDAADYVLQACEGIAEAHALGIVHRDLKPQNLFLARRSHQRPVVKVLDFGIAKSFRGMDDIAVTATHAIMGSPAYMSPEQMRASRDVDSRTDVWSLGVVLYELLAGALPFEGHTVADLCARVLMQEPVVLDQRRADIPRAIHEVIRLCLAKDVAERLPSVADIAVALEPYAPPAARGTADRLLRLLEARQEAQVVRSERTLPDQTSISAPHPGLLPTVAAAGNATSNHAVRTAATFESLGSSVSRERSIGKFVAVGALAVVLLIGLGFALGRAPSHHRGATAGAPTAARGAASIQAVGAAALSAVPSGQEPAAVPPQAVSAATSVAVTIDAGVKPVTVPHKPPPISRAPMQAAPKADAAFSGSQYF